MYVVVQLKRYRPDNLEKSSQEKNLLLGIQPMYESKKILIQCVKIGVFGLGIDLKGLVEKKLYSGNWWCWIYWIITNKVFY